MHVNLYVELFMSLVIMVDAIEPTLHLPMSQSLIVLGEI